MKKIIQEIVLPILSVIIGYWLLATWALVVMVHTYHLLRELNIIP